MSVFGNRLLGLLFEKPFSQFSADELLSGPRTARLPAGLPDLTRDHILPVAAPS